MQHRRKQKTLPAGPRSMAIEVLCRWQESGTPLDQAMAPLTVLMAGRDPRDYQLARALILGVVRRRGYLDAVLARFSSHPLRKMRPRTLQALRVGLFQILFMDRIPPASAVFETVQALKACGQPGWLTGFVNGLLRTLVRRRKEISGSGPACSFPLAARLSHPPWLIERWCARYGRERTIRIAEANNIQAPLTVRVNASLVTVERFIELLHDAGLGAESGCFAPNAVMITEYRGAVHELPGFDEGLFQVQDEAAQLIAPLLGPLKDESYLDGCAGPGGKTTQLAQLLPADGKLLALEPAQTRVERLRENLDRLHLSGRVAVMRGKMADLPAKGMGPFAGILLDAPCSGLGVIRRRPDIRWNRSPDDLLHYQDIQASLLEEAAALVLKGGILVYATCSMEPEENEDVVHDFLTRHRGFMLSDPKTCLSPPAAGFVDEAGFFRTVPGRSDLDGFFAARLVNMG